MFMLEKLAGFATELAVGLACCKFGLISMYAEIMTMIQFHAQRMLGVNLTI